MKIQLAIVIVAIVAIAIAAKALYLAIVAMAIVARATTITRAGSGTSAGPDGDSRSSRLLPPTSTGADDNSTL